MQYWQVTPSVRVRGIRTKPPGHIPRQKPPSQKPPGQKPPRTNFVNDKTFSQGSPAHWLCRFSNFTLIGYFPSLSTISLLHQYPPGKIIVVTCILAVEGYTQYKDLIQPETTRMFVYCTEFIPVALEILACTAIS